MDDLLGVLDKPRQKYCLLCLAFHSGLLVDWVFSRSNYQVGTAPSLVLQRVCIAHAPRKICPAGTSLLITPTRLNVTVAVFLNFWWSTSSTNLLLDGLSVSPRLDPVVEGLVRVAYGCRPRLWGRLELKHERSPGHS